MGDDVLATELLAELESEFEAMQELAAVVVRLPEAQRGRVLEWFRRWSEAEFGLLRALERLREENQDVD